MASRKMLEVRSGIKNNSGILCNVNYIPKYGEFSSVLFGRGWGRLPSRLVTLLHFKSVECLVKNFSLFLNLLTKSGLNLE